MAKRKYKRLHYEDRQTIEAMSKQGSSVSDIAECWERIGTQFIGSSNAATPH